ncbi:hypothetical protein [Streptomyces sp. NPDC088400]|uniref:hypothetical protein n=1 Tax=Streptomyces sp. NPDC088400 TaxID=3365861 RepID=UPI003810AFFA
MGKSVRLDSSDDAQHHGSEDSPDRVSDGPDMVSDGSDTGAPDTVPDTVPELIPEALLWEQTAPGNPLSEVLGIFVGTGAPRPHGSLLELDAS